MKRFTISAFILSFISLTAFAFSEKDIISPASGTWCNQQALVLSSGNGSEIYYSLTGSDPFVSGFAYDGPVLIEKKGNVKVRIGVIEKGGEKKEFVINYNVMPAVVSELDDETKEFAEKNLVKSPLITYRSGTEFSLPSGIRYSFDKDRALFLRNKLKLHENNFMERFVSFFATDGLNNYHSVIRVVPGETTRVGKKTELPFSIKDWNCFSFSDKRFIYQIDDEMWSSDYTDRFIDRNAEHTIHWQSVDYEEDSSCYEFVLPSIPEIKSKNVGDGIVHFLLPEEGKYTFENGEKTIRAEAFFGEETEGTFSTKIYLDGILNGELIVGYKLDKLAPEDPVITTSGNSVFSRNTVALKIECSEDAEIYYAVSDPVYYEDGESIPSNFESEIPEDFDRYLGSDVIIGSYDNKPCAYRIFAYAVDAAGNSSKIVEQKYIIDEFNFYVGSGSKSGTGDGSYMNPFVSLDQALSAINSSEGGTKIHLIGDITVEGGDHIVLKDCVIHGNGGKIIFNGTASFVVEKASVKIDSCTLEKHDDEGTPLAKINCGSITFDDCEISGFYREDGKLFEIKDSDVSFVDCGLTVSARRFSVCGEIYGGSLKVSGSRFTVLGQSVSALKLNDVDVNFEHNLFTMIGGICKGVEISGGNISFDGDVFNAQSGGKYRNSGAVFKNGGCKVSGLDSTTTKGF